MHNATLCYTVPHCTAQYCTQLHHTSPLWISLCTTIIYNTILVTLGCNSTAQHVACITQLPLTAICATTVVHWTKLLMSNAGRMQPCLATSLQPCILFLVLHLTRAHCTIAHCAPMCTMPTKCEHHCKGERERERVRAQCIIMGRCCVPMNCGILPRPLDTVRGGGLG